MVGPRRDATFLPGPAEVPWGLRLGLHAGLNLERFHRGSPTHHQGFFRSCSGWHLQLKGIIPGTGTRVKAGKGTEKRGGRRPGPAHGCTFGSGGRRSGTGIRIGGSPLPLGSDNPPMGVRGPFGSLPGIVAPWSRFPPPSAPRRSSYLDTGRGLWLARACVLFAAPRAPAVTRRDRR